MLWKHPSLPRVFKELADCVSKRQGGFAAKSGDCRHCSSARSGDYPPAQTALESHPSTGSRRARP